MAIVHSIEKYKPLASDSFFFDNNVWMYLFCPIGNYQRKKQDKYSSFLDILLTHKNTIFINSLVLSEFCNAYLRLDFDNWRKKPENSWKRDYKRDFVGTVQFKNTANEIKEVVKKILTFTEKGSDEFNAVNLDNIFNEFGVTDFNDSYYIELGRLKKYKIVTDDADFFKNNKLSIEVITANI